MFQLDEFKSLHGKWLFHQASTLNWLFGVAGIIGIYTYIFPKVLVHIYSGKFIKPPKNIRAIKVQESTPDTPRAIADDTMKNRKFSEQEPC